MYLHSLFFSSNRFLLAISLSSSLVISSLKVFQDIRHHLRLNIFFDVGSKCKKSFSFQNNKIAITLIKWPPNQKVKELYFFQLRKFEKFKCLYFFYFYAILLSNSTFMPFCLFQVFPRMLESQNDYNWVKWPQNREVKALYFLKFWKFEEIKYL